MCVCVCICLEYVKYIVDMWLCGFCLGVRDEWIVDMYVVDFVFRWEINFRQNTIRYKLTT